VQHAPPVVQQHDGAMRADIQAGKRLADAGAVHHHIGGAAEAAVRQGQRINQRQHPLAADARLDRHAKNQLVLVLHARIEFTDGQVLRIVEIDLLAIDHQPGRIRATHRLRLRHALLEVAQVVAEGGIAETPLLCMRRNSRSARRMARSTSWKCECRKFSSDTTRLCEVSRRWRSSAGGFG
jgi:hypothetical protein